MKFPEFNRIVNPNDTACYVAMTHGKAPKSVKYEDIVKLAKIDETLEIGWVIPKGFYVVETRQTNILPTIQHRNEEVMVVKTPTSIQIFMRGTFDRKTVNNVLACGIGAETYTHSKRGEIFLLPFKMKGNTAPSLKDLTVEHSNGISDEPKWLRPLRKISNDMDDGVQLPIVNNTQVVLLNILKRIKHLNRIHQNEIINLVNTEFCATPLNQGELGSLLNISEEQLLKQFYDKDKFMHNKLGDYLIKNCNIKRDKTSKELFYFNETQKIYQNDPDYILGYMTKLAPSLKNYQKEEVLKYVNAYLYDESVEFNDHPFTIVFKNGILNLETMVLEPMDENRLESIKINANYNPNAKSPIADQYFATATAGDKAIEQLLYEAIGYSMLKTNELQKAFILVGDGRNGKSTYLDIIKRVLGKSNYASISFKDLSNNFRASMLIGKLASLAGDVSSQPIQDSDLVKSITAGEDVTLEEKYKTAQTKALYSTLFFSANKLPRTPDTSDGFYRRWTIIPFIADLSKVSRVKGMKFHNELMQQQSLDYIAYKAVHAIYNVLTTTEEFSEPQAVKDMLHQYRVDNSTILSWFKETYNNNQAQIKKLSSKEAYVSYTNWCTQSGRAKSSITTFTKAVKVDIGIEFKDA